MTPARRSSLALLMGVLTGFCACAWFGHEASRYSKPSEFRRFHQLISPDTIYYPPYAMLEHLALVRVKPGQTIVIVGGNSIFNGVGQPKDDVWTQHLQELLGDRYVVVNLAFRGALSVQGAAFVAEALIREGRSVIYVANTSAGTGAGLITYPPYGYYYWQALAQHRLEDYPPRERALQAWIKTIPRKGQQRQAEEALAGRLEAPLRFESLWHHVAYRYFFTVWNFIMQSHPWIARDQVDDNEAPSPPLDERYRNNFDHEMKIVRGLTEDLAERDREGRWVLSPVARERLDGNIEDYFVPALRPHTLMVLTQSSPYYRQRLTPDEQSRDRAITAACAELWRNHGIACIVACDDFDPIDFHDRTHLSGSGGRKLAAQVAAEVKKIPLP